MPEGSQHCTQEALYEWEGALVRGADLEKWARAGAQLVSSVVSWLREVCRQKTACLSSSRTNLGIIQHPELDHCKLPMKGKEQESVPGLKGEGGRNVVLTLL